MQRQLGASNVFLLIDDTKTNVTGCMRAALRERQPGDGNVICINHNESLAVENTAYAQFHQEGSVLLLVYRYLIQLKFKFLWIAEADVRCNGDWHECLWRTEALQDDFVCRKPGYNNNNSTGWWWTALEGELADLPLHERWGGWMQIKRFSRRALDVLGSQVGRSSGFFEVYLLTLFKAKGLTVGAIDEHNVGIFSLNASDTLSRYPTFQDDKLYHPIKAASLGGA